MSNNYMGTFPDFDRAVRESLDETSTSENMGRAAMVIAITIGMTPTWVLENMILKPLREAAARQRERIEEGARSYVAKETASWQE